MNLLVIAHGFPPTQHSGVFRTAAFVKYFPEFGINPFVFTASEPIGSVLEYPEINHIIMISDYKLIIERINWNLNRSLIKNRKILYQINRTPILSGIHKLLCRRNFLFEIGAVAEQFLKTHSVDVIYASAAPPECLLLAQFLSKRNNIPFISDLRDPWVYYSGASYRSLFEFYLERKTEQSVLQNSAIVVTNTETARKQLLEIYNLDPDKIITITNGFDEFDFTGFDNSSIFDSQNFNVVYTGLLSEYKEINKESIKKKVKSFLKIDYRPISENGNTRSLYFFLRGLEKACEIESGIAEFTKIHLIGNFSEHLKNQCLADPCSDMVIIHGVKSSVEANAMCMHADLLLLLQVSMYYRGQPYCTAVPGKFYNYLRSGSRIIAPMQESDTTNMIRDLSIGVVVPPTDIDAISNALIEEFNRWKKNKKSVKNILNERVMEFDRKVLTKKLARSVDAIASK